MRPPCEIVTQILLPLVRGLVAQELITKMTQQEVADKMGVSQPAVSSYLKSLQRIQEEEEYLSNETIQTLVKELSEMLINNPPPEEVIKRLCSSCVSLRIGGLTCRKHLASYSGISAGCRGCLPITEEILIDSRKKVLFELHEALQLIESDDSFVKLMPQVMINLCQTIPHPKTIDDVAAIPGRITKVRGKARALLPPEFGVSSHTARILIKINRQYPEIKSAICIIFNERVKEILDDLKVSSLVLSNKDFEQLFSSLPITIQETMDQSILVANFTQLKKSEIFALINRGGVGIEPITYLFGESAVILTKFCAKITEQI